jgi:hypothetical protein
MLESSPVLSLASSEGGIDGAYENYPIWKSYQIMKQHFPNISPNKEEFFKKLCENLPIESDPEIQSCDGLYIDVLWESLTLSITIDDKYSITCEEEFEYFDNSGESLDYIIKKSRQFL